VPSFNLGYLSDLEFEQLRDGILPVQPNFHPNSHTASILTAGEVATHFMTKLANRRARELTAGNTLYGPHRDELRFLANDRDLRIYGSRGQQRTTALSLKLAEVQAMTMTAGAKPLLLLDDVMSELDARRRSALLAALDGVEQAIITTTDWEDFTPEFRRQAQLLEVNAGTIYPPRPLR
jgi:DNA replication and repair protein RecF